MLMHCPFFFRFSADFRAYTQKRIAHTKPQSLEHMVGHFEYILALWMKHLTHSSV